MKHELITCDSCNDDGELNADALFDGAVEGTHSCVYGGEGEARRLGWQIDHSADEVHVCPACVSDRSTCDDGEP